MYLIYHEPKRGIARLPTGRGNKDKHVISHGSTWSNMKEYGFFNCLTRLFTCQELQHPYYSKNCQNSRNPNRVAFWKFICSTKQRNTDEEEHFPLIPLGNTKLREHKYIQTKQQEESAHQSDSSSRHYDWLPRRNQKSHPWAQQHTDLGIPIAA